MEITQPDSTIKTYPLERLTKLYDGIEQLEDDLWGDETSAAHEMYSDDGEQTWTMNEDGVWQPEPDSNEWEEYDDDSDAEEYGSMDVDSGGWADEDMVEEPTQLPQSVKSATSLKKADVEHSLAALDQPGSMEDDTWKRFDILSSTPQDHAFFSSPPAQPSKSFLGRLTREYRVLSSSLPGWRPFYLYIYPLIPSFRFHHRSCI